MNKELPGLIKKELDKNVIGQSMYKKAVSVNIYRHIEFDIRNHMLVYGPTGSGKTYVFDSLKKSKRLLPDYTIFYKNISRITEEGYKGGDISEIFDEFKKICISEHNYKFRGIIFLDEVDKLIASQQSTDEQNEGNHSASLQCQLMQILDGVQISNIPTNNILFVFSGVFEQLNELDKNEKKTRKIGFITSGDEPRVFIGKDETIREKLIEIGFQREFLGRIRQIVSVDKLSEIELKALMLHPTRGIVAKTKKEYKSNDIDLIITPDAIDCILGAVVSENLGARSGQNVIESVLNGALYNCLENGYNRIIIDKESVFSGIPKYELDNENCSDRSKDAD